MLGASRYGLTRDGPMTDQQTNALLSRAHAAQQSGDVHAASALYHQLLILVPEHPGALNSLGVLAINRGEFATAVSFHQRAAAADPSAGPLWLNLARAQRELGDVAGERASLEAALAIDRLDFMALIRMAQLHERVGENGEAAALWSGIVQIAPPPTQRGEGLNAILEHGQSFVAAHGRAFADEMTRGLADARTAAGDADLRRFDACVDVMLGKRRVYTNQCAGLHVPFLPVDEFFDRSYFAWMAQVEAQSDAIRDELIALLNDQTAAFAPYVSQDPGTPNNLWTSLDNSLAWSAFYLWKYGIKDEAACLKCPQTAAMLASIPGAKMPNRAPTAFFSILKPRTRIPPHTGVTNSRTIIHLPLIVPDGCGFRVGGETREWRYGEALAFDDTIEHEAWNDSDALRAVLIFDVWNPHLTPIETQMIQTMFDVSDASAMAPKTLRPA